MKTNLLLPNPPFRSLTLAVAAGLCALTPVLALPTPTAPVTKTISGDFKSSDGDKGTYANTVTVDGATRTEHIVYTRASDNATSTDDTKTVVADDKSRTIDFSHTDFGATAAFTSHKTITREKHGQFAGAGTYTTATGDTGTLSSLESKDGGSHVTSEIHNSTAKGITQTLSLEVNALGFVIVKDIILSPSGDVTTVVNTRYVTDVDKGD